MQMKTEQIAPGAIRIVLDGRLDIAGASTIDTQFSAIAAAHKGVVVDLGGVSFLASIGVRTLITGAKIVQRRGGVFVLLNPVDAVTGVLEVTGVTQLMPIYRDAEAASAAVVA